MKQLLFIWLLLPTFLYAQHNYTAPAKTGDPVLDDANHTKAKTEWIKANPDAYRAMGGNPDEVLKANQPETKKETPKIAPFAAEKTYTLVDVRAVAAEGWQVGENELAKETELIQQKIQTGVAKLQFGAGKIHWFINQDVNFTGLEILKSDSKVDWVFKNEECPTCSKTFYLKKLPALADVLVYLMKDQDQDSKFAFQFTFQLIP